MSRGFHRWSTASFHLARGGVKAAPVPLRSLSSPPAPPVPLTPPLMPRAPATTKAVDQKEGAMALLEKEVTRFAASLDDYEHVSVSDIGGQGPDGYWLVVRDHRFGLDYEIASHCDYWDFIGALVNHRQCVALAPLKEVA